jgi:hypothetical protein
MALQILVQVSCPAFLDASRRFQPLSWDFRQEVARLGEETLDWNPVAGAEVDSTYLVMKPCEPVLFAGEERVTTLAECISEADLADIADSFVESAQPTKSGINFSTIRSP